MIRELFDTEVEAVVGGKGHKVKIENSTVNQTNNQSADGSTFSGSGAVTLNFAPQTNSIG
jgi:hypothetical protein